MASSSSDKQTVGIEKQFGERVRTLRLAMKWSQEELAFRAGIHRTYLGDIERGCRNPSLKNIAAIAKALDVPLSHLFLCVYPESETKENFQKPI